jgi:hypothetical protein
MINNNIPSLETVIYNELFNAYKGSTDIFLEFQVGLGVMDDVAFFILNKINGQRYWLSF